MGDFSASAGFHRLYFQLGIAPIHHFEFMDQDSVFPNGTKVMRGLRNLDAGGIIDGSRLDLRCLVRGGIRWSQETYHGVFGSIGFLGLTLFKKPGHFGQQGF